PLHADVTAQLFYPPAWLAFGMGLVREEASFYWLELLVVVHLLLGRITALLGFRGPQVRPGGRAVWGPGVPTRRSFCSPCRYGGGGGAGFGRGLAWLGIFALAEGFRARRLALLSISLAMIFLAGFPAVALVAYGTTAALAAWLAIRKRSGGFALAVLAGFVLA